METIIIPIAVDGKTSYIIRREEQHNCISFADIQTQPGSNLLEMWNNTVALYNYIIHILHH